MDVLKTEVTGLWNKQIFTRKNHYKPQREAALLQQLLETMETKHDSEEGSPCKITFLMVLDSCMEKIFSLNWFCGTPQVFWTAHLSEIFALLKETVGIASAQKKRIITLFLIWKIHLLCTKQTHVALVTQWKFFSPYPAEHSENEASAKSNVGLFPGIFWIVVELIHSPSCLKWEYSPTPFRKAQVRPSSQALSTV